MSDLLSRVIAERDTLREELRQIKAALAAERAPLRMLGLSPCGAAAIAAVMRTGYASHQAVREAMFVAAPTTDGRSDSSTFSQVCKAKRVLRKHGIMVKTVYGSGYAISLQDREKLNVLLES